MTGVEMIGAEAEMIGVEEGAGAAVATGAGAGEAGTARAVKALNANTAKSTVCVVATRASLLQIVT